MIDSMSPEEAEAVFNADPEIGDNWLSSGSYAVAKKQHELTVAAIVDLLGMILAKCVSDETERELVKDALEELTRGK